MDDLRATIFERFAREFVEVAAFAGVLKLGPRIDGIEVTQAVQYYHASDHLTDAADRGPDNSVRLVAEKPSWVRVYVRSGLYAAGLTGITGTLEVERRSSGFLWNSIGTLSPQPPGTVTAYANPAYATERGTLGRSLNFVVPAEMMRGNLRFRARITRPGETAPADTDEVVVGATLRQRLRLAGIMVGYNGPSSTAPNAPTLTLAAPTLADLQTASAWTLQTFPVASVATFRSAGTVTWGTPLTDAPTGPGGCSPNWLALNAAVAQVRIADGNQTNVIYYGLMAPGIPMGPVGGCNASGVSTGPANATITMAHEIGHYCGLGHGPCGTPGDPNYPAYEPYDPANTPGALIGEYGLNISNGALYDPNLFRDVMSYCGPQWISLYHHGRLLDNALLEPTIVGNDHFPWKDIYLEEIQWPPERWLPDPPPDFDLDYRERFRMNVEPVIAIVGTMRSERDLEIQSVARVLATKDVPGSRATDLVAELIGEDGGVLAAAPVRRLVARGDCGDCCGGEDKDGDPGRPPFLVQAFLSDVAPGSALRIRREGQAARDRGEEELWSRMAPPDPPKIGGFEAGVDEHGTLGAAWRADVSGEREPEFWLRWSNDDGQTWHPLAIGLREPRASVPLTDVPSGEFLVQVLAHDGFFTSTSEPNRVSVPPRSPAVTILHPQTGRTVAAGGTLRLWGVATSATTEPIDPERCRWLVDGEEVARGLDAYVAAPPPGEHRCTLVVDVEPQGQADTVFATVEVPTEEAGTR